MATDGYLPTRDQMTVIVRAARSLYRTARRWRSDARLPGYPLDMGSHLAAEALFRLERALNPKCLAWEHHARKTLRVQCWPSETGVGLTWLRNLLDLVLERNRLQAMTAEVDWSPAACWLPQVITIEEEELTALGRAIGNLPSLKTLPEPEPVNPAKGLTGRRNSGADTADPTSPPVMLMNPRLGPLVLGKTKKHLTSAQYRVVKALLDADGKGLKKSVLEKISASSDAVNVLKRLADSDLDWAAVIKLPGQTRTGYRIGHPEPSGQAAGKPAEPVGMVGNPH